MRAKATDLSVSGADDRSPVGAGEPIKVVLTVDVEYRVAEPKLDIEIKRADGETVLVSRSEDLGLRGSLLPGAGIALGGRVRNALPAGDYVLTCALVHSGEANRLTRVSPESNASFEVAGTGSASPEPAGPNLEFAPDPVDAPVRSVRGH